MNAIIAVITFVVALLLLIAMFVGVILFILLNSSTARNANGCDFCPSDSASSLGGGQAACNSCASKRL